MYYFYKNIEINGNYKILINSIKLIVNTSVTINGYEALIYTFGIPSKTITYYPRVV